MDCYEGGEGSPLVLLHGYGHPVSGRRMKSSRPCIWPNVDDNAQPVDIAQFSPRSSRRACWRNVKPGVEHGGARFLVVAHIAGHDGKAGGASTLGLLSCRGNLAALRHTRMTFGFECSRSAGKAWPPGG